MLPISEHETTGMVVEAPRYRKERVLAGPCKLGGALCIGFSSALLKLVDDFDDRSNLSDHPSRNISDLLQFADCILDNSSEQSMLRSSRNVIKAWPILSEKPLSRNLLVLLMFLMWYCANWHKVFTWRPWSCWCQTLPSADDAWTRNILPNSMLKTCTVKRWGPGT